MTFLNRSNRFEKTGSVVAAAVALMAVAGGVQAQITLDPAAMLPMATRPDTTALADLDGDGDLDMAVTSDNPDKVSILLNNGSGLFGGPINVFTGAGSGAGSVAAADLDGDGDRDLAVALQNTNSVMVLRNLGGGTFTPAGTFAVGTNPRGIVVGRLDADADLDLAVLNRDSSDVSILLNDGTGAFSSGSTIGVGQDPRAMAGGDWDGDTDMDLAVTNHDDRSVSILSNNGSGGFTASATLSVGGQVRPDGIAGADLDGDGDLDLAVSTSGNGLNLVSIFINSGGAFTGPVNFPEGGVNPGAVTATDLDCDGDMDLAVANQDSNDVSALPNTGAAVFGPASIHAVGTFPGHIAAGDLDGNNALDLVTANRDSDNVSILSNRSSGCAVILALTAARSMAAHKTGPGTTQEFAINLDITNNPAARTSEPRQTGPGGAISILEFDFSTSVTAAGATIIGPGGGVAGGGPLTLMPGPNGPTSRGRIQLASTLANEAVYTIQVTAATGAGSVLNQDICAAALVGDFDNDGTVTATDKAVMVGFIFQTISQANARFDVVVDGGNSGTIEVHDLGAWTGFFGTGVAGMPCP